jgi:murein DD-endopeptidase MepM/ murein hydrolase activator NlpD
MSFVDTLGAMKVRKPTATWYNPASQLVVTTISGLDRKVKLEIIKGTNVVETQTSPLITLANRIVASDASEFYGVKFNLTPPADGNYTLRTTVLDINGNPVSNNSYTFNVDTAAPTAAPIYAQNSGYSQVTTGAEWKLGLGNSGYEYFFLNSVLDSSGIASGKYIVYRQERGGNLRFFQRYLDKFGRGESFFFKVPISFLGFLNFVYQSFIPDFMIWF